MIFILRPKIYKFFEGHRKEVIMFLLLYETRVTREPGERLSFGHGYSLWVSRKVS